MSTPAEDCDRILDLFIGKGWIPIRTISIELRELGWTRGQGQRDLRTLIRQGGLEKRESTTTKNSWGSPSMEYRVVGSKSS